MGSYQEKRAINELQYLLDTLLDFKTARPMIYSTSVFPLHGWKICRFINYCNPQLKENYKRLIME